MRLHSTARRLRSFNTVRCVWAMVTVMHRDASASVRAVVACVDSCCGTGRTGIPLNMILDRPGPRALVGGTVERFG